MVFRSLITSLQALEGMNLEDRSGPEVCVGIHRSQMVIEAMKT